jgi:signal transduction histidine kinase/CheY-like chemotaxis protein
MFMIVLITVFALCLTVFVINLGNWQLYRDLMQEHAKVQTEMHILSSEVALAFGDQRATQESLEKLSRISNVVAAVIYDSKQQIFAKYYRNDKQIPIPVLPTDEMLHDDGEQLTIKHNINAKGKFIGQLILVTDSEIFLQRIHHIWLTSLLSVILILLLGFFLFHWAITAIIQPLTQLSQVMSRVRDQHDYSARIYIPYEDDLGKLTRCFNEMLEEIEERDQHLERTVQKRTMELVNSVENLSIARNKAEEANRAKSAFLANMSHELRTPLNAILGFAQVMQSSSELPEQHKHHVKSIYNGGHYLLTLINDILDLAKVEAGRIELFKEEVHLKQFFQDVVEMFRYRAENKNIYFDYETETALPYVVEADPVRLRQVITNLLSNAVKFTEAGGVCLRLSYSNNELHIWVEDTGPGIDPADHQKVFKPFSQVGCSHYKSQGTGLGLAITLKIINLMKGRITLQSELGKGCCFYVILPLKTIATKCASLPQAPMPSNLVKGYQLPDSAPSRLKLLLVDDIDDNRAVLRQMLEPLRFDIDEVDNGEACLAYLKDKETPSLIFMDIRMPGLDGLETTRRLHKLPGLTELPVIAVSASVFQEDISFAAAAGCLDYLRKPVEQRQLLDVLQKHLGVQWQYACSADNTPNSASSFSSAQREAMLMMVKHGAVTEMIDFLQLLKQTPDCPSQVDELLELAEAFEMEEIQKRMALS